MSVVVVFCFVFFIPVEIITQESGSGTLRAIGVKGGQDKNKTKGMPVGKFKRIFIQLPLEKRL